MPLIFFCTCRPAHGLRRATCNTQQTQTIKRSRESRHELAVLVDAPPRSLSLLQGYLPVPVLLHASGDARTRLGLELRLHLQQGCLQGHELDLVPRSLWHQRPRDVLQENGHARRVDDDQLLHTLREVAIPRLHDLEQGRGIHVEVHHHPVQIPNVDRTLHASRHVVDSLQHADNVLIDALTHRQQLVLHAHVEHRPARDVGAEHAVVAAVRKLPRGQHNLVLLAPRHRLLEPMRALRHVALILSEQPPAIGGIDVFLRKVAEVSKREPGLEQVHQLRNFAIGCRRRL
mmetsp:Transcript_77687/g.218030  ORF Transcript_77687/g.218030 Transcript_77687/m.218030 type:complete len:288 (+) Transcript_77687:274-1137(+)